MFIVQNETCLGTMQSALFDLVRGGIISVRVCSAYMSMSGSEILLDGIRRSAPDGNHEEVDKTIVTALDFGITDPEALAE